MLRVASRIVGMLYCYEDIKKEMEAETNKEIEITIYLINNSEDKITYMIRAIDDGFTQDNIIFIQTIENFIYELF